MKKENPTQKITITCWKYKLDVLLEQKYKIIRYFVNGYYIK